MGIVQRVDAHFKMIISKKLFTLKQKIEHNESFKKEKSYFTNPNVMLFVGIVGTRFANAILVKKNKADISKKIIK